MIQMNHCQLRKKSLTTAAAGKSNSSLAMMQMHTIYYGGVPGTNPRGESFMEYLVNSNLNTLNQGNMRFEIGRSLMT
jgi:hypothetical protein